jgi:catechol 2,3-dioxygenase
MDFYERVLGLREQSTTAGVAALGVGAPPLLWLHERRGIQPAPPRGAYGLFHFAILLPERAALGSLLAHLSSVGIPIGASDHLVSEALYLSDPDGLGIEVYSDRPRDQWKYEDGELKMTTAALDTQSLLAAAGAQQWDAAPEGTTIGHIHLHVGNLTAAEAFYHSALGFDKTVWSYPGALFFSAGGYHHHLGTNTWARGPSAREDQARLLEWELLVPTITDAGAAAESLQAAGCVAEQSDPGWTTADPWGTRVRVTAGH